MNKTLKILAGLLIAGTAVAGFVMQPDKTSASSTSIDTSSCEGHVEITSDNTKVDNANDNIMYDLSLIGGASDFWSTITEAGDIRVTNSAGDTAYSFEVENFSTASNTGIVYFDSSNLVTGSDVTWRLYVCTAKSMPAASDTLGAQNVWNANYALVVHDPSNGNDSTANGYNGTPSSVTQVSGQMGNAGKFDGSSSSVDFGDQSDFTPGELTWQAWAETDDTTITGDQQIIHCKRGSENEYAIGLNTNNPSQYDIFFYGDNTKDGGTDWSNDTWYKADAYWDEPNGGWGIFVDGSSDKSGSTGVTKSGGDGSYVVGDGGEGYFDGTIDEIRVYKGQISANWISTEYNNQSSPSTFWTTGSWTVAAAPVEKELLRPFIQWFN